MPELVNVPVADLLLSPENPRLSGDAKSQPETMIQLAKQQRDGEGMITLAADIVANGLDPLNLLAVVPTPDRRTRYRVIEGNRRVLAIRALEAPALVQTVLTPRLFKKLTALAAAYEQRAIDTLPCMLFGDEEEARHWIKLRHTGQNDGAGLVTWGAEEIARFQESAGGRPHPARQLLAFVEAGGLLSQEARDSRRGVITTLERLVETPYWRDRVGLRLVDGQLVSLYPAGEILKILTRVVEDLKTGRLTVPQVYHLADRKTYTDGLPSEDVPRPAKQLPAPIGISDLAPVGSVKSKPAKPSRQPTSRDQRTTIIPKNSTLNVTNPRLNQIYSELLELPVPRFPNAGAVLLRVFLELLIDHYISVKKLRTDQQLARDTLGWKIRLVADDLNAAGQITLKLKQAVHQFSGSTVLQLSVATMHSYVHNEHSSPKFQDLVTIWDDLEQFIQKAVQ